MEKGIATREHHKENKLKSTPQIKSHVSKINILVPIFISALAFVVEIISTYYFSKEQVSLVGILHMANGALGPTQIATASMYLHKYYSQINWYRTDWNTQDLKGQHTTLLIFSTIILSFMYIICMLMNVIAAQIVLFIIQLVYLILLLKVEVKDIVLVMQRPTIMNSVSA